MSKSPRNKSQRYEGDKIDFIIPFLVNNHTEKSHNFSSEPPPVKKTCILNQWY